MKLKTVASIGIIAVFIITMWVVLLSHLNGANNGETDSDLENVSAECNWGLSFQVEGETPIGNATVEELQQYNAYYIDEDSIDDKGIYLTFDAGYENGYTEKILDVLKEEGVTATFFLVGNYIEENPELVKRMVEEGHTVGNHTMHHPNMSDISNQEDFKKELEDLEAAYEKVIGEKMEKLYRAPQGKYSEENLKQAAEMGYTTVFWSLAYVDWYENQQPTREQALNTLNSRIHPGAIVLLHSTSKTNSEILQELIQGWKNMGYKFKNLCENLT